jgi:hypothetical protein
MEDRLPGGIPVVRSKTYSLPTVHYSLIVSGDDVKEPLIN